jgi:molybdopterin molybdotransferase
VSTMDGYAVRGADLAQSRLAVMGDAAIGAAPGNLPPGACLRIVTGAPIPQGAEGVVRREDVVEHDGAIELKPGVQRNFVPGLSIRRQGENAPSGAVIAEAGSHISPAVAASLATFGIHQPRIHRRIRAGVIVTGDELVAPHESPEPWQIRDGNGAALLAMFAGFAPLAPIELRRVRDQENDIQRAAAELLERCDALFFTGGVSMGHRDFVPSVLKALGAETVFHRVPQRPGRPVLGGITPRGQPVMGLPGNPVSVLVTARRMAVPVIQRLAGMTPRHPPAVGLSDPDSKAIPIWWYRLIHISPRGQAKLKDNRGSGDVVGAARSDGFIEIPPNQSGPGPWAFYSWAI